MKTKIEIRKEIISKLSKQDFSKRKEKSLLIKEKLFALPEFKEANLIMFYVSTEFEVDTTGMIDDTFKMGKRIAVPYISKKDKKIIPSAIKNRIKDLAKGPYGIYQPTKCSYAPVSPSEIDLVIVPGVAFTKEGIRLGRGGGFYDNFLRSLPKETPTAGIAFDLQIVPALPHEKQDMPVKRLITA